MRSLNTCIPPGRSSANGASASSNSASRPWRTSLARVVPGLFPPEIVVQVKALACELPANQGVPLSRWSRRGFAATLPSSRLVAQAVDDWHASRSHQSRAPGLLPRRIYVPIQSPNEPPPWQVILQISPTSGGDRTDTLQGHGQKRKGPQAPQIRHIVAT